MKKLMIFTSSLRTGGGEKLVLDIARKINKALFDVTIVSLFGPLDTIFERKAKEYGLNVIFLNKKNGLDLRMVTRANKLIKQINPDVISTHLGALAYLIFTKKNIKKFHTVHSMADKEAGRIRKIIHGYAFKFRGFVPVAICPTVLNSIAGYYNIDAGEIPCINNGIDREIFKYENRDKDEKNLRVIATGGFRPVKNHVLMVEAFNIFLKKFPDAKLYILGDGAMRENIEAVIKKYKLEEKIILKGNVSNVADELNQSDVYIMSSNYEGLSLAIAEAMSCGLPVVTTASGGTVDIVKDGINGFVTSVGDAEALAESLYKLAVNKDLRKQMAEKSLELAENFDIVKTVKQYEELFEGKR